MSDRQAIEAASATYRRCANLLADAAGVTVPDGLGLGPRDYFELTVELCRPVLDGKVREEPSGVFDEPLTMEDFSTSGVIRAFRVAALGLKTDASGITLRDTLIRAVNDTLQKEGLKENRMQVYRGRYADMPRSRDTSKLRCGGSRASFSAWRAIRTRSEL